MGRNTYRILNIRYLLDDYVMINIKNKFIFNIKYDVNNF